jgi:hypothetical protein
MSARPHGSRRERGYTYLAHPLGMKLLSWILLSFFSFFEGISVHVACVDREKLKKASCQCFMLQIIRNTIYVH